MVCRGRYWQRSWLALPVGPTWLQSTWLRTWFYVLAWHTPRAFGGLETPTSPASCGLHRHVMPSAPEFGSLDFSRTEFCGEDSSTECETVCSNHSEPRGQRKWPRSVAH